jgi:hypothetical protein
MDYQHILNSSYYRQKWQTNMADQYILISRHIQPTNYLSQSWLAGRFLTFSVAKPTRLVIEQLYSYSQMVYTFVIKAHISSHVPEGISAKKTHLLSNGAPV